MPTCAAVAPDVVEAVLELLLVAVGVVRAAGVPTSEAAEAGEVGVAEDVVGKSEVDAEAPPRFNSTLPGHGTIKRPLLRERSRLTALLLPRPPPFLLGLVFAALCDL